MKLDIRPSIMGTEDSVKTKVSTVIYINLKKNWHRRLMMWFTLTKVNLNFYRHPGVLIDRNKSYSQYLKNGVEGYLNHTVRKKGVIGCWISHHQVLESISQREGCSIVLEDDFSCTRRFFQEASNMIEAFKLNFDVIIFDPWGCGPLEKHKISENIYLPENTSYPYYIGSHCLFYNNSSIDKILDVMNSSPIKDYDGFLFANPDINAFIVYSGLSAARNYGSDIAVDINKGSVVKELHLWFTSGFFTLLGRVRAIFPHIFRQILSNRTKRNQD